MVSEYVRAPALAGKGGAVTFIAFLCTVSAVTLGMSVRTVRAAPATLQILMDRPPASLDPRSTLDATGQHINSLLYSALTRIDADLNPKPDLAKSWRISHSGRELRFRIRAGLKDHSGHPITPADIRACLEQYRVGKPVSPYLSSFPHWIGTRNTAREVVLELNAPDPYILRNLSLLRYFRTDSPVPCSEPMPGKKVIGSGPYRTGSVSPLPETQMLLTPMDRRFAPARLQFVSDDNSRLLRLLRGNVDATLDSLSLTKERWIQTHYPKRFRLIERDSTRVSYLAFNLRDPILAHLRVRRAIAMAIDRAQIVKDKLFGFASLAGSLLAPELPESLQLSFRYDPKAAEKLLDEAGYPRKGPDHFRFTLHYKTTFVREGFENALMIREMLRMIGIRVVLDVVEPAVFLNSVRKGYFQLVSSLWIGIGDGSILYRTLDSHSPDDRAEYHNPKVDRLLEQAMAELDLHKRTLLLQRVQRITARDLPYFPLWYWHEGLIVKRSQSELGKIRPQDLSLTGALEPILLLR